jgi:kexin
MDTAIPVKSDEDGWQQTAIGKRFSHTFGYGRIDSWALVEKSRHWELVKPQAWFFSAWIPVKKGIPQGMRGLAATFNITKAMLKEANIARLEHVTVTMNVDHTRRGDLSVDLISPQDVISHLSVTRRLDAVPEGYKDWTFMSVVHWYVSF